MAKELSQEEVLDFLCQGGGKVPNASLLAHFRLYLRDTQAAADQLQKHRERFKRYVNSVAVVKQEGAVKYVVLRSRYRDLLGEELSTGNPGEELSTGIPEDVSSNNGQEMGSSMLLSAQVGGGYNNQSNRYHYQQGGPALTDPYQTTLNDHDQIGNFNGKIDYGHSHPKHSLYDPGTGLHPSQPPSPPAYVPVPRDQESKPALCKTSSPVNNSNKNTIVHDNAILLSCRTPKPIIKTSSSPSDTGIPSTKVLSSSNASIPITKTSSSPSNLSISCNKSSSASTKNFEPLSNNSSPYSKDCYPADNLSGPYSQQPIIKTYSSPSDTCIPSTNVLSPSDASIPITKTSSSPSNLSISFNKSSSSPSSASTKTSEPPSNTSSPYSKDCYPADNLSALYSKDSSFCSSTETHSLPQSPSLRAGEHWRPPQTKLTNSAFVSYGGQQEQKLEHSSSTEILAPNFNMNGTFPQEVHSELEGYSNYIKEVQSHGFHKELCYPPSSRYMNCTQPSSFLPPHEPSISPLDEGLEYNQPASSCPSPSLPLDDMRDLWMCQMPVFKSIRCQLSLQDMEDFVDQESGGSEESDSGEGADCDTEHKDEDYSSDSNNEKYAQYIEEKCENTRRCPPNRKFLSIIEQYNKLESEDLLGVKDTLVECGTESNAPGETWKSPYIGKSFLTDQAPILFELARQPQKHRASARFRETMSSSDDELIDRDFKKRRRPSRTKKPVLVPPQPDVDLLLTVKPVSSNPFVNFGDQKDYKAQYIPKANMDFSVKTSFNYKPSTVPLDPTEHDWIIKSASGSWLQVYGLFIQDPQLALRKDFISGYTALHWFAKHGAIEMFYKFSSGASKAGIDLDYNIKSNGGYTPLHIAAIHGHHKVAAMLVEKLNVNVKLRDNSGKRAWQYLNCNTSGEVWQLLGAPKGKTIFASRTLHTTYQLNTQKSRQVNRKTSLAAFLKPQHQKWKANNHPVIREREIYSD